MTDLPEVKQQPGLYVVESKDKTQRTYFIVDDDGVTSEVKDKVAIQVLERRREIADYIEPKKIRQQRETWNISTPHFKLPK